MANKKSAPRPSICKLRRSRLCRWVLFAPPFAALASATFSTAAFAFSAFDVALFLLAWAAAAVAHRCEEQCLKVGVWVEPEHPAFKRPVSRGRPIATHLNVQRHNDRERETERDCEVERVSDKESTAETRRHTSTHAQRRRNPHTDHKEYTAPPPARIRASGPASWCASGGRRSAREGPW